MVSGTVKHWDSAKGYGFIVTDNEQDYFFHVSNLDIALKPQHIREGMRVKFDIQSDFKGDKAIRVRQA